METFFIFTGISAAIAAIVHQKTNDDVFLILSLVLLVPFVFWMVIEPSRLVVFNAIVLWINLFSFTKR